MSRASEHGTRRERKARQATCANAVRTPAEQPAKARLGPRLRTRGRAAHMVLLLFDFVSSSLE